MWVRGTVTIQVGPDMDQYIGMRLDEYIYLYRLVFSGVILTGNVLDNDTLTEIGIA